MDSSRELDDFLCADAIGEGAEGAGAGLALKRLGLGAERECRT